MKINKLRDHINECETKYSEEIINSKNNAIIMDDSSTIFNKQSKLIVDNISSSSNKQINIILTPQDTISALYNSSDDCEYTILNFASYRMPDDSINACFDECNGQQEALYGNSFLYNVLERLINDYYNFNSVNMNNGFYKSTAVYTPDIIFKKYNLQRKANVISCSAPNLGEIYKYATNDKDKHILFKKNSIELIHRIEFLVRSIAYINSFNYNTNTRKALILGAFGCGYCKQNPKQVASIFKQCIVDNKYLNGFDYVIFAVPHSNNFHSFGDFSKSLFR